ncbi:hypothetical protein DEO72_LG5g758 [Vigna unguiculata]|uniref:Uncharacterized protein n=1 Tax=Vigna unguiculata TaxID=3917 RepID=A0A4D6LW57_VIGUN|nr:hypothetical protein DEO72_LG5g758 [Vigna unguiculata]
MRKPSSDNNGKKKNELNSPKPRSRSTNAMADEKTEPLRRGTQPIFERGTQTHDGSGEATIAARRRQRRGDGSAMATSVSSSSAIGVVNLGERGDGGTPTHGGSGEATAAVRRRYRRGNGRAMTISVRATAAW